MKNRRKDMRAEEVRKRDLSIMNGHGMLKAVDAQMQQELEKMRSDLILKNHPYDIFESKDGRFRTYVMDGNKRKMIAKSTKEAVEQAVIDFYKGNDKKLQCTLKNLYPDWIEYKSSLCAISTVNRIECDWIKYYKDTDVVNIPITKLDYITLNQWANSIVKRCDLSQKQYMNLSLIIKQILLYAVDKELLISSPFERVKVTRNLFSSSQKKASDTQVFLIEEQPLIETEAFIDFKETKNLAAIAIPLAFQTGLRIGELVALKFSDIDGDYLHIQRMERIQRVKTDFGKTKVQYVVVNHTKSAAGYRRIYLTSKAKEILKMIQDAYETNGYKDSDFIFVDKNGRIHKRALDTRIRKYCAHCGITEKSMHKIRKTFISSLIDNQLNINYIREVAGHESEKTTYQNYCYNRLSEQETVQKFEQALINL